MKSYPDRLREASVERLKEKIETQKQIIELTRKDLELMERILQEKLTTKTDNDDD
jgi:hypothetical protein